MSTNLESHKFLPSGKWRGFYCYNDDPCQHKMHIELTFRGGIISGSGVDDVSPFTWKGKYNLNTFKAEMKKSYQTHFVFYQGDIDEQGIWGTWDMSHETGGFNLPSNFTSFINRYTRGGFHIWPESQEEEEEKMTILEEKSEVLEKVYIEKFA